tara:strand:- start:21 stop:1025 length:1005 start_codon:yes stop_codon:yes gene_type:complete
MEFPTQIAIIGAGLSGLVLAEKLQKAGFEASVFDKARGVGGRMATRYADPYYFDHGAQFLTARSGAFKQFLQPLVEQNVLAAWEPNVVTMQADGTTAETQWDQPHYVATPHMNMLCKRLMSGLAVELRAEVSKVTRDEEDGTWQLWSAEELIADEFDWVISTAPAPQTAKLFPEDFAGQALVQSAALQGCFTLMLGMHAKPTLCAWDVAEVQDSPVAWMAWNDSKPGRDDSPSLVVHSANDWAEARLDSDQKAVEDELWQAVTQLTGIQPSDVQHNAMHRWRYAKVAKPAGAPFVLDTKAQIGACGDWCIDGKVEAAFESASALADAIIQAAGE